jgi:hypothetical protein
MAVVTLSTKLCVLVAVFVGALVLAGCSSSDETSAGATPSPSGPSTVESTRATAEPVDECTVEGFVPRTTIQLRHTEPVVVYAHRVALAPGSGFSSPNLDLARADLVPLRVRPDDRSVELPREVRHQILVSGAGPIEGMSIVDEVRAKVRIRNDSNRNRLYLVYRGSFAYSGDWTIKACGAPYNDGTTVDTVTGHYSTVTKIRPVAVTECRVPASGSELDRYAADLACRDF